MKNGFKKLLILSGAVLLLVPLFVFSQENSWPLKQKQTLDILDIIRKYPLNEAQGEFYNQSLYYPMSDYPEKTGAVMLVKQTILQEELDYWFAKVPYELSKKFIKAVYKLLPLVAYGDFSGAIDLIEEITVEQANKYINDWLKQNQVQIGSGIGKYTFQSFKNNWQTINIPYIIVYSSMGQYKTRIVVEFYSSKLMEPPPLRGNILCPESIADTPSSTCWPQDIWIQNPKNKSGLLKPFIVRVKGQITKDQFGNFAWDKTAPAPTVEVDFDNPVPEIDQSDIILKNLQSEQNQGFLQRKINQIKQTVQGIINQIKEFLAIFKPQAQIASFIEPPESSGDSGGLPSDNLSEGSPLLLPLIQEAEAATEKDPLTDLIDQFDDIAEQSEIVLVRAEQLVNEQNAAVVESALIAVKSEVEEIIEEKQIEFQQNQLPENSDENMAAAAEPQSQASLAQSAVCNGTTEQEPSFSGAVFNEITWMGGVNSSADEWLELKNISGKELNLAGWQIFNKSKQLKVVFSSSLVVAPASFFLLERTDDNSAPTAKADLIYTGAISNTNEALYLVDANCVLQDKAQAKPYWQAGDNSSKKTMERTNDLAWQTSAIVGGTPKAQNSVRIPANESGGGGAVANSGQTQTATTTQQNSTSTQQQSTSTQQTATSTGSGQATSTAATSSQQISTSTAVLIVEIQTADASSTHSDFIKIYNPSTSTIADISSWQLKKRTSGITESSVKEFSGRQFLVQPQAYFLWMNSSYELGTTTKPDATTTQTIASNNSIALFNASDIIIDQVAWGSSTNPFVESQAFSQNPQAGQNLTRKFSTTTSQYQDTNNNSQDFELSGSSQATSTTSTTTAATSSQPAELPGIVNLMAIPSANRKAIDLFWSSPTSSASFIVKKAEQEITTTTWETAQAISQSIAPKPAGQIEFLAVDNLLPNTKYFFAIKYIYTCQTCESATSSISNSAFSTTWQGFLDNGNGTLFDLRTGLMWQKNSQSQINNFGATTTQPGAINFVSQQNSTSSTWFAGYSDWRLPNFKELTSVFNYKTGSPAVSGDFQNISQAKHWAKTRNQTYFPGFPGDEPRFDGWYVNLQTGEVDSENYSGNSSNKYPFLATRGTEIPGGMANNNFNFTDNGDGTISDIRTGLMWLNDSFALADDSERKTWQNAFNYANNAVLCQDGTLQGSEATTSDCAANAGIKYSDWRLPNVQEILEITKQGATSPAILPWQGAFSYFCWTGTMFDENNFWQAGDGSPVFGKVSTRNKNSQLNVQLVREP